MTTASDPRVRLRSAGPWSLAYTALLLTIGVLGWNLLASPRSLYDPTATPRGVTTRGEYLPAELATMELFEAASPSVAYITSVQRGQAGELILDEMSIDQGSGSGVVWDQDGHVVTNFHVVRGGVETYVTLADRTTWRADIVGGDPYTDLAVLKIQAPGEDLAPVEIGRSSDLRVGQNVYAIGNPFGLDHTLTTGIISGLGREILSELTGRPIHGVIQTDAAINPGNSGGPLLDSSGLLIGINTAIVSPSGAYAGVGFAVPVDTVNRIVPQIIRQGHPDRPGLGIYAYEDVKNQRVMTTFAMEGVAIQTVVEGAAADQAGLVPTDVVLFRGQRVLEGDVITGVDGVPVAELNDLLRELGEHEVGDEVKLNVARFRRGARDDEQVLVTLRSLNASQYTGWE